MVTCILEQRNLSLQSPIITYLFAYCCTLLFPILAQLTLAVIYLWRKVVYLFCLYLWDPPNPDTSDCVLGLFGKLSTRRGAWAWFHDVWTCGAKVLEYWMISSLKTNLNCSLKISEELECLWCLGKILMSGIDGIYLVRFGFRMWEILILKVISAAENSSKFQTTRFWKEKNQLRKW